MSPVEGPVSSMRPPAAANPLFQYGFWIPKCHRHCMLPGTSRPHRLRFSVARCGQPTVLAWLPVPEMSPVEDTVSSMQPPATSKLLFRLGFRLPKCRRQCMPPGTSHPHRLRFYVPRCGQPTVLAWFPVPEMSPVEDTVSRMQPPSTSKPLSQLGFPLPKCRL